MVTDRRCAGLEEATNGQAARLLVYYLIALFCELPAWLWIYYLDHAPILVVAYAYVLGVVHLGTLIVLGATHLIRIACSSFDELVRSSGTTRFARPPTTNSPGSGKIDAVKGISTNDDGAAPDSELLECSRFSFGRTGDPVGSGSTERHRLQPRIVNEGSQERHRIDRKRPTGVERAREPSPAKPSGTQRTLCSSCTPVRRWEDTAWARFL